MHHMGVDRTLILARTVHSDVTRERVWKVVGSCDICQSIDTVSSVYDTGTIQVKENWKRLAIDVTHYQGKVTPR